MPVYNAEAYLREAIESLLYQTFQDFELLIINDGSTDRSEAIIAGVVDPRIRLVSQTNQGLAAALNRGIQLAQGRYLARQDADDLSLPARLERQVAFLDANPDHGLIGTWAEIWSERTRTGRYHRHPVHDDILRFNLLFDSFFVHSSVMIRKDLFDVVGMYATEQDRQPEDFELWSRIVRNGRFKVANIPEVLVVYREVPTSICRTGMNPFLDRIVTISAENIAWASKLGADDPGATDLAAIVHGAAHRISPRADFGRIRSILHAAAGIAGNPPFTIGPPLAREVDRYRKIICRNYLRLRLALFGRRARSLYRRICAGGT